MRKHEEPCSRWDTAEEDHTEINLPIGVDRNFNFLADNNNSVFLGGVCERDVLGNQKSTDGRTIDTSIKNQYNL